MKKHIPILPTLATLMGMILGVGMFGVPYVLGKVGALAGLGMIAGIAVLVTVAHILFAEILMDAPVRMRLPNAAERVFGPTAGRAVLGIHVLGAYGAMVAYTIAAGSFAAVIFGVSDPFLLQILCFLLMAGVAVRGRAAMTRSQIPLIVMLLAAVVILLVFALPAMRVVHLVVPAPGGWLTAYGVFLFALGGLPAIPTVVEALGKKQRSAVMRVVVGGTLAAALVTAIFGVGVLAASGPMTSDEAIRGLVPYVGEKAILVGAILGLLAVITSFLALAVYIRDVFLLDCHLPKPWAWACTLVPPLVLFLLGARQLIPVIAITGGIFWGFDGMVVAAVALAIRIKKQRSMVLPLLLLGCFSLGVTAHVLRVLGR